MSTKKHRHSSLSREEDSTTNATNGTLVGDDLSSDDLDALWAFLVGEPEKGLMADWWNDKPHQIAYRLLLRLTRAEAAATAAPDPEYD